MSHLPPTDLPKLSPHLESDPDDTGVSGWLSNYVSDTTRTGPWTLVTSPVSFSVTFSVTYSGITPVSGIRHVHRTRDTTGTTHVIDGSFTTSTRLRIHTPHDPSTPLVTHTVSRGSRSLVGTSEVVGPTSEVGPRLPPVLHRPHGSDFTTGIR